jgi:hypothetical protein
METRMEEGEELMVRIDWTDREGQCYADSAMLKEVPKAVEAIRQEKGRVVGVRKLEDRCDDSR